MRSASSIRFAASRVCGGARRLREGAVLRRDSDGVKAHAGGLRAARRTIGCRGGGRGAFEANVGVGARGLPIVDRAACSLSAFCESVSTGVRIEARVPMLSWQKCEHFVEWSRLQLEAAAAGIETSGEAAAAWSTWIASVDESGAAAAFSPAPTLPLDDGRRERRLLERLDTETAALTELADETAAVGDEQREYLALFAQMSTIVIA